MILDIPKIPNPLSEIEEQQVKDLAYRLVTPQGLTEKEKETFNRLIKLKLYIANTCVFTI